MSSSKHLTPVNFTQQIVFIDSQVEDYQTLAAGVVSGAKVIILDFHRDGIEQITSVLNRQAFSTIHIVSHGSPGCLYLGNSQLSLDTLDKYEQDLKTWSSSACSPSVSRSASILLYGCNVAAGDAGIEFVAKLNRLTGSGIAASTTPIGNVAKGGNWDLDLTTDLERLQLAFSPEIQQSYAATFADVFTDDFDGNTSGGTGNWTVNPNATDTATTNANGQWIIAPITEDPFDANTDFVLQLDPDTSPNALITGYSDDNDEFTFVNGITTVNSPRFTPTVDVTNTIGLNLQYYNFVNSASGDEEIKIEVVDASNDTVLQTLLDRTVSNESPTSWSSFASNIDTSLAGTEVYLQISAENSDGSGFFDFAIDSLSVTSGLPWDVNPYNGGILVRGAAFISCGTLVNGTSDFVLAVERVDVDADGNPIVPTTNIEQEATNPLRWSHEDWTQAKIGNVYGLDVDLQGNMYAAASSNYGSGFFGQDANVNYGSIGGGANNVLAAGTVYKMDAVTGAPAVFVQLPQQATSITHVDTETGGNPIARTTGPGLGNIHHDKVHDQFFVSNFEDGRIYRVDSSGNILDSYDPNSVDGGSAGRASIDETVYGLTVSPDGSQLFFGRNDTVYSIDLNPDGSLSGTSSSSESYTAGNINHSWTNYSGATETTHATVPDAENVDFSNFQGGRLVPLDSIISDLDFLPTGELVIGTRSYNQDNLASSYNHGGHNYIVADNGSGIYSTETEIQGFSTNTASTGGDDGYGGVAYTKKVDADNDSFDYVFSSADIISEPGPHGLTVFPDNASNLTNTSEITPRGAIDYGGGGSDPKGVGGDVDVFNPGSIQGNVSQDTTGDGNGDVDLSGITITLYDETGTNPILDFEGNQITATTDTNGDYIFDNVFPGNYTVVESQPLNLFSLSENEGGGDNDNPSADNTLNNQISVTVSVEENDINNDFVEVEPASLGDTVFSDSDGDGIQDVGENGVNGVTVNLTGGGADGVIGTGGDDTTTSTVTDTNGNYSFTDLTPGVEYQVTFDSTTLPANTEFTTEDAGSDDATDSDADANGLTDVVTLAAGENNPTIDAGIVNQTASLGDTVFFDSDGDGIFDAGENGVNGVTVNLVGGGADGVIGTGGDDTTTSTVTDTNGNYSFTDLTPGVEYQVSFDSTTLPAGNFGFTQVDVGFNDAVDSDANANGETPIVTLVADENNTTIDAGIVEPCIKGKVWSDSDRNGLEGFFEDGVENLTVTLTGGGADGVIGNSDDTTATLQTDANGEYHFTGLNPSEEYQVSFGTPGNLPVPYDEFTSINESDGNDLFDSDANLTTGVTPIVTLAAGEVRDNIDAGLLQPEDKNRVEGTASSDTLVGTNGDDLIAGYKGQDVLTGGSGSDCFFYNESSESVDLITDFESGTDQIDVSKVLRDELGYSGSTPVADNFISFADYGSVGTMVQVDFDGNGSLFAKDLVFLQGVSADNGNAISQSDLII